MVTLVSIFRFLDNSVIQFAHTQEIDNVNYATGIITDKVKAGIM